jgi:PPOX class probable F420-dependent enzyme
MWLILKGMVRYRTEKTHGDMRVAHKMTSQEVRSFLQEAPRTGHLATVREDGRPHVATIWFVLDGDDVVFTTWHESVKGRNLTRTGYAALSVDDPTPPFSFVTLEGPVTLINDSEQGRHWASIIGGRYMGSDRAEEFGKRNGVPGEYVCRLRITRVTGMSRITE